LLRVKVRRFIKGESDRSITDLFYYQETLFFFQRFDFNIRRWLRASFPNAPINPKS